jgi:hypothetical protein
MVIKPTAKIGFSKTFKSKYFEIKLPTNNKVVIINNDKKNNII